MLEGAAVLGVGNGVGCRVSDWSSRSVGAGVPWAGEVGDRVSPTSVGRAVGAVVGLPVGETVATSPTTAGISRMFSPSGMLV